MTSITRSPSRTRPALRGAFTALVTPFTSDGALDETAFRWLVSWQRDSDGRWRARISGPGLVETFAYETEAGFALHVLNYTNPNLHRGTIRAFYPIGSQSVRFEIPPGRTVSRVQLLKSETDIPFKRVDGGIEFTIPSVTAYEVAAIYA